MIDNALNPLTIIAIIVENSNDKYFKDYIEKKFKNVSCYLTKENLQKNNIGIRLAKLNMY